MSSILAYRVIVYWYFGLWRDDGTLERINAALVEQARTKAGRKPSPSKVIVDSQSVKTTQKGGARKRRL
jgi:transposase